MHIIYEIKELSWSTIKNYPILLRNIFSIRNIIVLILFSALYNNVNAQNPNLHFAFNMGGTSQDNGNSMAQDASGNIYVTGNINAGTSDFDPGPGTANLTGPGIFVAKYNSSGAYQWAFKLGGPGYGSGFSIYVDASSNLYITGQFGDNIDFDPGPGVSILTSVGAGDIFVAKYNSSGTYQWAFNIGSTDWDFGKSIAVDATGNVYVTGYFRNTADFDPGSLTANLTSAGTDDIFVAKYSSSGAYQWAFRIGSTSIDRGLSIALDISGNVYLTGEFSFTADFDPGAGTGNLISAGAGDFFVAKYNSSGSYQWAFRVGNIVSDCGNSITVDGSGNVYVTGYYQMTSDFDPGPGTANLTGTGAFVAKYSSGGIYQWAFAITMTSSGLGHMGNAIVLDGLGNFYLTGFFSNTADFDPGPGTVNLTMGGSFCDIFIAKYTTTGSYIYAFNVGGSGGTAGNRGLLLVADGLGNVYGTGYFEGTADFDPNASTYNLTSNGGDIFIAKYSPCQLMGSLSAISGNTTICSGSTNTYNISPVSGATSYTWTLPSGWTGNSTTASIITTAGSNGGIISVTANNSCGSSTAQTITVTVNPNVTTGVSIVSNPTGSICSGTSITFTATPFNGGTTPSYQWQVNGINVGTNTPTYTSSLLTNGDIVTVSMTSNAVCATPTTATSNAITMTVLSAAPTSVSISASSTTICVGNSVIFTAIPINGGATAAYQWQVNGMNVGTNSSIYTSAIIANGDVVKVIMTSSLTCVTGSPATSNSITMSVTQSLTPLVNIAASSTTICAGASVTFTAAPTNGGTSPGYQWQVNGINVGINNPVYTSNTLNNGDLVTCILTSNYLCVTATTATSNILQMTVNAPVIPSVSIAASATTICTGTLVTFTATPVNGGPTPSYQWKVNSINVGSNSPSFSTNNSINGDVISCVLTNLNSCSLVTTANSNNIAMIVTTTVVPSLTITSTANNICPNASVTFTAVPTNVGTTPSFQWILNGINVGGNNLTYSNNSFTNGDKINCIMNTVTSCSSTPLVYSDTITMIVKPAPVISFNPSNPTISLGSSIQLNATVTGNLLSYLWTPSTGLSNPAILNPIASPVTTTIYTLNVVATNSCSANKQLTVTVFKDIHIPNSFTPNDDGLNDIFRIPPGTSLNLQYFIIYDRYGNEIFKTTDVNKGWDGTYKAAKSPNGAYTYVIKGSDSKREVILNGTVIVIR